MVDSHHLHSFSDFLPRTADRKFVSDDDVVMEGEGVLGKVFVATTAGVAGGARGAGLCESGATNLPSQD